jgi:hypothetical protein
MKPGITLLKSTSNSSGRYISSQRMNDVAFQWFDSKTVPLFHGALLHNGKYYKFDYPKAVQTYGGGLNDKSTITGGYEAKSKGPFSGYKATFK